MQHRAIKNLSQLSDNALIKSVGEGLGHIYNHCINLDNSVKILKQKDHFISAKILEAIAKEEAAKYFILLDAMRCPVSQKKYFSNQLSKFNDHLAKGLYVEVHRMKPDSYKKLKEYIKHDLDEYYLDGPSGVDWIFRNPIIAKREESLYVDYVNTDDENMWIKPSDDISTNPIFNIFKKNKHSPVIIERMKSMNKIGISNMEILNIFAKHWRNFTFDNRTTYSDFKEKNLAFLKKLEDSKLLVEINEDDYNALVTEYPFPLYKESMKTKKVKQADLREIQNDWYPE